MDGHADMRLLSGCCMDMECMNDGTLDLYLCRTCTCLKEWFWSSRSTQMQVLVLVHLQLTCGTITLVTHPQASLCIIFHLSLNEQRGKTPLLLAVFKGHAEVAQFLLENGSDVHEQNNVSRICQPCFLLFMTDYCNCLTMLPSTPLLKECAWSWSASLMCLLQPCTVHWVWEQLLCLCQ